MHGSLIMYGKEYQSEQALLFFGVVTGGKLSGQVA